MTTDGSENHVVLTGRVSKAPERRELPSGDLLVTFRLVVDRDQPSRPAAKGRPRSDWFDCSVWTSRLATRTLTWRVGDRVTVEGGLRRRYFRGGSAPTAATRVEVEVVQARMVQRASSAKAG